MPVAGRLSNSEREVRELNERAADAFNRGDYEGLAAHYTEEAVFLAPDRPLARGRDAIRDVYADLARSGVRRISFETLDVEDYGQTVVELGLATMTDEASAHASRYYLIVWRRDPDGALRIHRDAPSNSTVDAG